MLSPAAYEIGSVVYLGGCTLHSLAVSSAKDDFKEDDWIEILIHALCELESKRLIEWEYWSEAYGTGAPLKRTGRDGTREFGQILKMCVGTKKSQSDFWADDRNSLKDIDEPTIDFVAARTLGAALDDYESNQAEQGGAGQPATRCESK